MGNLKDRQYNGQIKKYKMANNDQQTLLQIEQHALKKKRGWTSMVRKGRESITQCLRSMFLYDKAMDDYVED